MDPQPSPQGSPRGSFSAPDPHTELAQLKTQMAQLYAAMQQQFAQQAAQQSASVAAPVSSSSAPRLPKIRSPPSYAGAGGNAVEDWLVAMQQQFAYYGAQFPSDDARVMFAVGYLDGPALQWWTHVAAEQRPASWDEFAALLRDRYRPVQAAMLARQRIGKLRMGPHHHVNAYTAVFQTTLTPIGDMGAADQVHHYVNGLQPHLAGKVWERHPKTLKEAIDYAVSAEAMGNFGRAAMPSRGGFGNHGRPYGGGASASPSGHVPMDINSVESFLPEDVTVQTPGVDFGSLQAKMESMQQTINALQQHGKCSGHRRNGDRLAGIKPEVIAARLKAGTCLKCGGEGHMKNECTNKQKNE
jgi:hypothetical protein